MSELDLLRGLADQISQPPLDALRETARLRSRRRTLVTAVSAAAVAAVVIGVAVLTQDRDEGTEQPIEPPGGATTRPVTYADGATVHYGEGAVSAPDPVVELDLTDIQFQLCEFAKYWKAKTLVGRPKKTFSPTIDDVTRRAP